ncbi:MAG: DNA double-strand break repair nuclease NurA [Candidatus Obscuribacterales bacterium]|nr:DNA double-strand break repair nuclease NurA [Candidatus Obscuribacterales bacterium]
MLDFNKLIPQIKDVGQDTLIEGTSPTEILRNAQQAFESAADRPSLLKAKLRENGGHTFWPLAIPIEPFGSEIEIEAYPGMHTVVACDGSQIMPTAHEVYSCYLLNIGAMVIHYGCDEKPILTSFPRLFHKADEVYPLVDQRRVHVNDSVVSLERQLMELTKASELAVLHKHADMPLVTMVDGSLIPWNVDSMPDSYQTEYLQRMLEVLDVFCAERIPLIGYVSHSRSSDIVNNMRVWECPYPTSKCQTFCGHLNEEDFPCSTMWPLSDRLLLSSKLPRSFRSGMFSSGSRWSTGLGGRHNVCFCYLHTDAEVARLEIPRWMYDDKQMLDLAISVALSQAGKGLGYPIALSEAHNLAVIRQADRKHFFDLLTSHLVGIGVGRVSVSPKESRKRRSII